MLQRIASCFPKCCVYGNGGIIEVMVGVVSWNISGIVIGGYDIYQGVLLEGVMIFTRVYFWRGR